MNCFHKESKTEINRAVKKLSQTAVAKLHGKVDKAGLCHTKGCETASSLCLRWNILEGEKNSKTHENRKMKREGVVGRERGNGTCNLYKDFGQCSTKPQQRMKALYRQCFKKYISTFTSALGCCAYVVFASHFLSHLSFKESCQHL